MAWMRWIGVLWLLALPGLAQAQSKVPDRQVPSSVMIEVELLQNRFDLALAGDCHGQRCFSTGCNYVEHAVADRPPRRSLPGLADDPGPGSVPTQAYLTRARCSFAHEPGMEEADVEALALRLRTKMSSGWTSVSVTHKQLEPLPDYLELPPGEEPGEETEDEPVTNEPPPPPATMVGQLWAELLPHTPWMFGIGLATLALAILIWSWRRLGATSIEDQMMLAEIAAGTPGAPAEAEGGDEPPEGDDDPAFVRREDAAWRARLKAMDPTEPDPELQALIRNLLRSGDMPLLAKAVLRFPDLPSAFPTGGEVAQAKLELAEFLKTVDPDALPEDPEFFRALNRHALAAAVSSQGDAEIVRSLREDFGAAGLAGLIGQLPARTGSLLFALAPSEEQHEMLRLLAPEQLAEMSGMLLRSNRMDPTETSYLFGLLDAVRTGDRLPAPPASTGVSDRGPEIDAAGALSLLLEGVNPDRRSALFADALGRFGGSLPSWHRGILFADMLLELPDETRADLMLEVDIEALAAWLSTLDADTQQRLLTGVPSRLQSSVRASTGFASRARQLSMAERGRRELSRALGGQLARAGLSFEQVAHPVGRTEP